MMIYTIVQGSLFKYSGLLSKILDVPDTVDYAEIFDNDRINGTHIFERNVITINKNRVDEINNETANLDKIVRLAYAVGIIAHEKKHFHQAKQNNLSYISQFLLENKYFSDLSMIDAEAYVNLEIEIDARAFAALVEEHLVGVHFPLPTVIDLDKFNKRKAELDIEFGTKIRTLLPKLLTF